MGDGEGIGSVDGLLISALIVLNGAVIILPSAEFPVTTNI